MTRLAILAAVAFSVTLAALSSHAALPPPGAGIGDVRLPIRPPRLVPVAPLDADPFMYQRPAAVWPLMRGCSDPVPCRYLFGTP
jgi:hypothetical protein